MAVDLFDIVEALRGEDEDVRYFVHNGEVVSVHAMLIEWLDELDDEVFEGPDAVEELQSRLFEDNFPDDEDAADLVIGIHDGSLLEVERLDEEDIREIMEGFCGTLDNEEVGDILMALLDEWNGNDLFEKALEAIGQTEAYEDHLDHELHCRAEEWAKANGVEVVAQDYLS